MENRDRDRVSQRTSGTEAGDINRKTSERQGREGSAGAEFGENIGRSENLESSTKGGNMDRNKNKNMENTDLNESSRRPSGSESGYGSSSGRSGSIGSSSDVSERGSNQSGSNQNVNSGKSRSGSVGNDSSGDISSGRH
jgi:hypothetical protein